LDLIARKPPAVVAIAVNAASAIAIFMKGTYHK
jgi:hypothetical protein